MSVMNQVGLVALKSSMSMDEVMEMIPFLLPVMIIELLLAVVALVHVLRHNHFRCGNKVIWALLFYLWESSDQLRTLYLERVKKNEPGR